MGCGVAPAAQAWDSARRAKLREVGGSRNDFVGAVYSRELGHRLTTEQGVHQMIGKHNRDNGCTHTGGCGCTPSLFVDMIENAGADLSRREFVKGVAVAGGVLAAGRATSSAKAVEEPAGHGSPADTIYHGGPIVTMARDGERVEAIAVKSGTILAAGTMADVAKYRGPQTRVVDLTDAASASCRASSPRTPMSSCSR